MNPAQDPESRQPAENTRILFLFSRQLDDDLTQEESAELAVLQQTDAHRGFLASMIDLRGQMKSLPVKPVAASFATSVHDAIHRDPMTVPATSAPNARRGSIIRGIVAVSVTACAAAFMLFLRSQNVDSTDGTTQIVQHEELRPFLENDQWRIVVLKVHSKDRKEVMRIVESLAAKNGMDMQSIVGKVDHDHDHDPRFSVLFTSTGDNDNALIDNVISETDAQSADWNPQSVADSTSESFIHRIQESMKTPTFSELHFGQVYVVLPNAAKASAAASQSWVAQNDAVERASLPSAVSEKATASPNDVATARIVTSAQNTPVLVVFEFNDTAPEHI